MHDQKSGVALIPSSDLQDATPLGRCGVRKFRKFPPNVTFFSSRKESSSFPPSLFPLIVARPVCSSGPSSLAALLRSNQFSPGLPSGGRGTVSDLDRVDQRSLTRMDRRFKPKWLNLWHPFASRVSGHSTELPIGTLRTQ